MKLLYVMVLALMMPFMACSRPANVGADVQNGVLVDGGDCFQALKLPAYLSWRDRRYFRSQLAEFMTLPADNGGVVFLGDSLFNRGAWSDWFAPAPIRNLGIDGDETSGLISRFSQVQALMPDQVIILIGTNDLMRGRSQSTIETDIETLASMAVDLVGAEGVAFVSILPRQVSFDDRVDALNTSLAALAERDGFQYVNAYDALTADSRQIAPSYTDDGVHLTAEGYQVLVEQIRPYLQTGLQFRSSDPSALVSDVHMPNCKSLTGSNTGEEVR